MSNESQNKKGMLGAKIKQTNEKKKGAVKAKRNANQLKAMLNTPNNNFGLAQLFKRFVLIEESFQLEEVSIVVQITTRDEMRS